MVTEISFKTIDSLSVRDLEVAKLLSQGQTNQEIADSLGLTAGTIKNYASNLMHKLGASNRVEAAVMLTESGVFLRI